MHFKYFPLRKKQTKVSEGVARSYIAICIIKKSNVYNYTQQYI
jgi:hypothetical protein